MKNLFYEDFGKDKLCVRRTMGMIGFLACITAVFVGIKHELLPTLLIVSASLLGLTTVDKFVKK